MFALNKSYSVRNITENRCKTAVYLLIDHFGHLLVELAHLRGVDVLRHVAALEEALDAAHLLHHLRELGVLLEQIVDLT